MKPSRESPPRRSYRYEITHPAPYRTSMTYDDYWQHQHTYVEERSAQRRAQAISTVEPYIRGASSVLEVGCGPGYVLSDLRSRFPSLTVEGIDNAPHAVAQAKERGIHAECVDLLADPSWAASHAYDVVIAFEVLEHIVDAEAFFRILVGLAKRMVIISVPNIGFFKHRLRYLVGNRFPDTVVMDMREHVRHWTMTDMREWLRMFPVDVVGHHGIAGVGAFGLQRRFPSAFARTQVIAATVRGNDGAHGSTPASAGTKT
ncbi:MAG: class I SAM-dependent methyltransferase [Candidatus Kerfeldbacteria bacterium]|nr:class I SAM-dependent methyltransferase [Candidatus Kerfeldbacteria bacterium]